MKQVSASSAPIAIGNQPQGGRGFEGLIDDVCLFNDAITTEEILYLYNNGNGRACSQVVNYSPNTNTAPDDQNSTRPVNENNNFVFPPIFILLDDDSE